MSKFPRTTTLSVAVLAASLASACAGISGQSVEDYPERPITYVIGFDPGGESDITARIQQNVLEDTLDTNVNITYKPGAAGAVAWSDVARAKPDGYTIAGFNLPHIISQPMVQEDAGYKTQDLKLVSIFQFTPNLLVVRKDSPIKTVEQYVDAAKEGADAVTLGGTGKYTPNHIGHLMLERAVGVKLGYTQFSGTGATVPALLGGDVDSLFTFPTQLETHPGEMRPLAIASEERFPGLEDVPTFKEKGYDVVGGAYRGVLVPEDTPDEVVQKLHNAFEETHSTPEVKTKFRKRGFVMKHMNPAESKEFVQTRRSELQELFTELGVIE